MTYKEQITESMDWLSQDTRTRFIGYGLRTGKAGGTLKNVPADQIIETPVAENLMTGLAIGQSLAGNLPVLYFERMDFILNAADAIVNHLCAAQHISRGKFMPAVIIRAVVGNRTKPLFTGRTHTQNFSTAFSAIGGLRVVQLWGKTAIGEEFDCARHDQILGESTLLVEYKDLL